jgi:acyl-coenzyme A synthetase/AMP-(fatty) acid ligase
VHDARRLTTLLKTHELVHDVAIVGYPLRDKGATRDIFGTALHAFVEAKPGLTEQSLRELLAGSNGPQPPERLQLVDALPRDDSGQARLDILRLIALQQGNQAQLMANDSQRETVARIVAGQPALAESTAR